MTHPPGTRVRVTVDVATNAFGAELLDANECTDVFVSPQWLAANPDKVTVLLDEPADGSVVLDRDGDAWQRGPDGWRCRQMSRRVWEDLIVLGPLTVIHAGGPE